MTTTSRSHALRSGGIALVALALAWAPDARASACPTTNVIQDPAEFQWTAANGYFTGTIEFGAATLNVGGGTLTTRAYRQEGGTFGIPGPTIRMVPGNKYVLTLKNTLPYVPPSAVENDFKDPNITNLHTHGLHVSPASPSDDVTRIVNGSFCGNYVYDLAADHMGGTLWYHPHHHGSTFLQVSTGAWGLLVVDDSKDVIPANVAAMTERPLVVGFLDPTVAGTGGDMIVSSTTGPTWTVNGKVQGNLCTPANEWQHWRVLVADADANERVLSVGAGCEVALLARDGVWRTTAPLPLPTSSISLTGASRADLAVRCSADSTITVGGTAVARVYADAGLSANTAVGPWSDGATGTTWSAKRPTYLRDLRGATNVERRTVSMGARTINGGKFDMHMPTFTIPTGNVQEWEVRAGAHPFHLHVYHFQMNGACGSYEDGEYYDTIEASCLTRFDLNPTTSSVYDGTTIMHCHILDHEDQGAMGWADVQGGMSAPTLPTGLQELYQCVATPPPVNCSAYLTRSTCTADAACTWNRKTSTCTNR